MSVRRLQMPKSAAGVFWVTQPERLFRRRWKSALCNIFYHDEQDYDWAIATWHSLTTEPKT